MLQIGPDLSGAVELVAERGGTLGRPMHLLATTTSTNDEAKRGAAAGAAHGTTWVAEVQTAGRGRQGRTWEAARGEALLFSVLLRLDCPPARVPLVSIVSGLAVQAAVAKAAPGARVWVKWPNDVVAGEQGEKKVSGVLVEAITTGKHVQAVVVGIGINVHSRQFPDEIAARATSVASLAGGSASVPHRAEILADVLAGLDRDLHPVLARGLGLLRARLDAVDALRGRAVRNAAGEEIEGGTAEGIDDDGRLIVRQASGTVVRWSSGEVHLGR